MVLNYRYFQRQLYQLVVISIPIYICIMFVQNSRGVGTFVRNESHKLRRVIVSPRYQSTISFRLYADTILSKRYIIYIVYWREDSLVVGLSGRAWMLTCMYTHNCNCVLLYIYTRVYPTRSKDTQLTDTIVVYMRLRSSV